VEVLVIGRRLHRCDEVWRPGDPRIFVSDITKVERELGWKPKTSADQGVEALHGWVKENLDLF
jgi:CDP-paratose 2-epimerase